LSLEKMIKIKRLSPCYFCFVSAMFFRWMITCFDSNWKKSAGMYEFQLIVLSISSLATHIATISRLSCNFLEKYIVSGNICLCYSKFGLKCSQWQLNGCSVLIPMPSHSGLFSNATFFFWIGFPIHRAWFQENEFEPRTNCVSDAG
jgi:hypothetical protein